MSKLNDIVLTRLVRTDTELRARIEELRADRESGLDNVPWTAVVAIGGGALALTIVGLVVAWATGYFNKLPG